MAVGIFSRQATAEETALKLWRIGRGTAHILFPDQSRGWVAIATQ